MLSNSLCCLLSAALLLLHIINTIISSKHPAVESELLLQLGYDFWVRIPLPSFFLHVFHGLFFLNVKLKEWNGFYMTTHYSFWLSWVERKVAGNENKYNCRLLKIGSIFLLECISLKGRLSFCPLT